MEMGNGQERSAGDYDDGEQNGEEG